MGPLAHLASPRTAFRQTAFRNQKVGHFSEHSLFDGHVQSIIVLSFRLCEDLYSKVCICSIRFPFHTMSLRHLVTLIGLLTFDLVIGWTTLGGKLETDNDPRTTWSGFGVKFSKDNDGQNHRSLRPETTVLEIDSISPAETPRQQQKERLDSVTIIIPISTGPSASPSMDVTRSSLSPSCVPTTRPELTSAPSQAPSSIPERYKPSKGEPSRSESPTVLAMNLPFVSICHCDEKGFCIDEALDMDSRLRLCLHVRTDGYSLVSIHRLDISQSNYLIVMIDHSLPVVDQDLIQTCHSQRCRTTMSVPEVFYEETRPPIITIRGQVSFVRSTTSRLSYDWEGPTSDLLTTFEVDVLLTKTKASDDDEDDKTNNQENSTLTGHEASTNGKPKKKTQLLVLMVVMLCVILFLGIYFGRQAIKSTRH